MTRIDRTTPASLRARNGNRRLEIVARRCTSRVDRQVVALECGRARPTMASVARLGEVVMDDRSADNRESCAPVVTLEESPHR